MLKKDMEYHIRFYMNTLAYTGGIKVLVEKDGDIFLQEVIEITECRDGWNLYELTLKAKASVDAANFHIILTNPGEVDFDCISMMPADAVCGVLVRNIIVKSMERETLITNNR